VLTVRLAPRVLRLLALEIDRDLAAELRTRVPPHVTIVTGDALDVDLDRALASAGLRPPLRVAGNLPYNISSPILFRLLDLGARWPIIDATLMLQREVADRLVARPGTGEYGVLSVLTQLRADIVRVLTLPPGAFRPPPKVRSALVRLTFRSPSFDLDAPELFDKVVRAMFTQRRKMLASALAPFAHELGLSAPNILVGAGVDPRRRPETLEIVEIARLADAFAAARK
jgi:16S rRNA (adenine1518-N6/adenine1519-N6)-dimethyltransferase